MALFSVASQGNRGGTDHTNHNDKVFWENVTGPTVDDGRLENSYFKKNLEKQPFNLSIVVSLLLACSVFFAPLIL